MDGCFDSGFGCGGHHDFCNLAWICLFLVGFGVFYEGDFGMEEKTRILNADSCLSLGGIRVLFVYPYFEA